MIYVRTNISYPIVPYKHDKIVLIKSCDSITLVDLLSWLSSTYVESMQ